MASKSSYNKLTGVEKAAIILMSMDEGNAKKIMQNLHDEEIKEISHTMSNLGNINPEVVERLIFDFTNQISASVSFVGNLDNTEKLLCKVLDKDRVNSIMEDIRGPAGRNTWDKLCNVNEEILASYLKSEYPQTVALIISKLSPGHASKVLTMLPEEFTFEVILRILDMDAVKKEVLDGVERALRAEFISTVSKTQKYDNNEMMAEIFNNFDRSNETKFMGMLEGKDEDAAERVKNLMFTFDDLIKIDQSGIQSLLREIDKSKLAIALKGANENIRNLFINNMSGRASKILVEDMEALGPVRLKDVDESQVDIINIAKELIARGEIIITQGDSDEDELIY